MQQYVKFVGVILPILKGFAKSNNLRIDAEPWCSAPTVDENHNNAKDNKITENKREEDKEKRINTLLEGRAFGRKIQDECKNPHHPFFAASKSSVGSKLSIESRNRFSIMEDEVDDMNDETNNNDKGMRFMLGMPVRSGAKKKKLKRRNQKMHQKCARMQKT